MSRITPLKQLWMHPLGHGFTLALVSLLAGCELEDFFGEPVTASSGSETKPVADHCQLVDPGSTISLENIGKLPHLEQGNSGEAMRSLLGLPHCFVGNVEYFPRETDKTTWIGIKYDEQGQFDGYTFSVNNPEPTPGDIDL